MAWILVAVLLVVCAGLALALIRRQSALRAQLRAAAALRRERDEATAATQAAEVRSAASEATAARAAAEVEHVQAAAAAERAAAEAADSQAGDRLTALWALAQIEQQRTWRLTTGSSLDPDPGLAAALAMEVERIREEVGTPGSLETRLEAPVAIHDASLALFAARELLAVLVPHTQAYDMAIEQEGPQLAIEVVCTGWEGPAEAADDVSRLLAAVAPAGGNLSVDTDPDGRLRATLVLPLAG
jgi:hypothetical protein